MSRHGRLLKSFSKSPDPKDLQIQTAIGFGNLKTSGIGTATGKPQVRFQLDSSSLLRRSSQKGL